MSKIRKYIDALPVLIFLSWFIYIFFEFKFDDLFIVFIFCLVFLLEIIEFIQFKRINSKLIKLGKIKVFKYFYKAIAVWFLLILFIILLINIDIFDFFNIKVIYRERNLLIDNLLLIYLLLGIFFRSNFLDANIFMSDKGLVKQKKFFEFKKWSDFSCYKLIEEENLIRLKKHNDKFIFIEYKEEYFKENREDIIFFLNKKLKKE